MKTILVTLTTYVDVPLNMEDDAIDDDFVWGKLSEQCGISPDTMLLEYELYPDDLPTESDEDYVDFHQLERA